MEVINFILKRLDNTTAWIGVIGLVLLVLNFHGMLAFLFIALFFVPEGNLSGILTKVTDSLKKTAKDYE